MKPKTGQYYKCDNYHTSVWVIKCFQKCHDKTKTSYKEMRLQYA